jgi:UDP-N-acetylglucosamine--N-acetylmuramyl-(pentapeptide) pyrophosphoryl-undecaprenol N-acetylglucosamine transferase
MIKVFFLITFAKYIKVNQQGRPHEATKQDDMDKELRIVISGGGTGGHIFPAVSIANAIKAKHPEAKILFVGALGRMEMQRVPAAGYEIKGLPISGFDRKHLLKNIAVLFKIWKSQRMAKRIIRDFKPMVAVGVVDMPVDQR